MDIFLNIALKSPSATKNWPEFHPPVTALKSIVFSHKEFEEPERINVIQALLRAAFFTAKPPI